MHGGRSHLAFHFPEELPILPPLVMLPTLGSAQVSTTSAKPSIAITAETNGAATVDKLTEVMSKLIQKQKDSTGAYTHIHPCRTIVLLLFLQQRRSLKEKKPYRSRRNISNDQSV